MAFEGHEIVGLAPFPLGRDGGDADTAFPRPTVKRFEDLFFGQRRVVGQRVGSHLGPPAAKALLALPQPQAFRHLFSQFGDARGPLLPQVRQGGPDQLVRREQGDGGNRDDREHLLAVLNVHSSLPRSSENQR